VDLKPTERWMAIAGVAVLSAIAVAGFAIAIYAAWLFHDMPDAGELQDGQQRNPNRDQNAHAHSPR